MALPFPPTLTSPIGTIGTMLPTFVGTYNPHYPSYPLMTHIRIEVERVLSPTQYAPIWNSGTVKLGGAEFSWVYAGITPLIEGGLGYRWRAKTASAGVWSPFASWENFTVFPSEAPIVTQVAPEDGSTPSTLVPTIIATFSDPLLQAEQFGAYRIQVNRVSDSVPFWDTEEVAVGDPTNNTVNTVYAGTTLVSSTAYEWRIRVKNVVGQWSDYSDFWSFTPSVIPGVPTSITPTGLVSTLTPTITGVFNIGLGDGESDFWYDIREGEGTTIYQSGDITTDIATGQAYGTNNPSDTPATPPTLKWGTQYYIRVRSKNLFGQHSEWSPWIAFNTNAAPTTPDNLSPSGAAIVSDTTPELSWVHNDPDSDAQTAVEIELQDQDTSTPVTGYDPKALSQATLTHTVDQTLTNSPATGYKWRIRTKGLAGPGFGPWSDWALFIVAPAPDVAVTSPTVDQVLSVPSHTVTWTFSGGSGTQDDYRVYVYASDGVTVLYDSTQQAGADLSWLLPATFLVNGNSYLLQVVVHDDIAQEGKSDLVPFTTSWTPADDVTGLIVTPQGGQI